jgi:hypothetical protein
MKVCLRHDVDLGGEFLAAASFTLFGLCSVAAVARLT